MKQRIAILTTAFWPLVGGAEIATAEIMRRTRADFEFVIITARIEARLPAYDTWEGIPIYRLGWGKKWDKWWLAVAAPFLLAKLKTHQRVDLVWAIMASYAGLGAMLTRWWFGIPYKLTLQEGDDLAEIERRTAWAKFFFQKIFRAAAGIQAIAPFLADWAQKQGCTVTPVVIPNGVTCDHFCLPRAERVEARAKTRRSLGIPSDAPVVITVSRLVKKNGVADLLTAVEKIAGAYVIVVGDGALRETLQDQALAWGERVRFVGTLIGEPLKEHLAAADVFCRPSLSEGQGIVFLEAMCAGLPVVATTVGGIPSIVRHEVDGLLVAPGDSVALGLALQRLLSNPEEARRLAAAGEAGVQNYSWEAVAPKIKAWLQANLPV